MYAGFLTPKHASSWLGAHQKLDRLAYRAMRRYILQSQSSVSARTTLSQFPSSKLIQHFEGVNGPDGIKVKSPGQNEPVHFYDPNRPEKAPILKLLASHQNELKKAIAEGNEERSAFEASWLAHAIVDGLTPAHHYPYEEEMSDLRGGMGDSKDAKTKKMQFKGKNARATIKNNWQVLGAKGLLTTHQNFEMGVASTLLALRLAWVVPSALEMEYAREQGLAKIFSTSARSIADLQLYERFYKKGWTVPLTRDVRNYMLPQMVKAVALAWLLCLEET